MGGGDGKFPQSQLPPTLQVTTPSPCREGSGWGKYSLPPCGGGLGWGGDGEARTHEAVLTRRKPWKT